MVLMVLVQERQHPWSLDFRNQRKVVMLRDVQEETWDGIAEQVVNLEGEQPSRQHVKNVYDQFNTRVGHKKYNYKNCGRKPWVVTPEIVTFLVRRLLVLRRQVVCTSSTLQREVHNEKGVLVSERSIRRALNKKGYHWLTKSQKRKLSTETKAARQVWARRVLRMSVAELRAELALALDGVVLPLPPEDPVDRHNLCTQGDTHMWRKKGETAQPELSGGGDYADQVSAAHVVGCWGGLSDAGFEVVTFHEGRKLNTKKWAMH